MTFQNCPRCGLSIRLRADYLAPRNCPRCIARERMAIPMYGTPHPARLAADHGSLTEAATSASPLRPVGPERDAGTAA
jgi:hypothetical protein